MVDEASAAFLNKHFAIEGRIAFSTRFDGIVALLSHGEASAIVAIQGAQVLSYETEACGELLWLSPAAKLGTGKAVRGGIPICWPWFGPHPGGGSRPAHGFVRARPWQVADTKSDGGGVSISLSLSIDENAHPDWPHAAMLTLDVHLGDNLTLSLTTRNQGRNAIALTQALHTYLRLSDIASAHITGLEGTPFIDQLDTASLKRESDMLRVTREIDRIYQQQTNAVTVRDQHRAITIAKDGSSSTVVWNPWVEKSARLGDMGDDGYRHMVCIETANAGGDIVRLEPGQSHKLVATIAAERC